MTQICNLCPRKCGAQRSEYEGHGICKMGSMPVLARAGVHMWEEPCISGTNGSGTVFFSGCSLKCVFCQNRKISTEGFGKAVTPKRLSQIYFELYEKGVHNINLVNPTHFVPAILKSLENKPPVPVVYNTGGYDSVSALKALEGKIDIYLPDMKYISPDVAEKYSKARDYPSVAKAAICEMVRQVGPFEFDENGLLKKGVIIRHLILPDNLENTLDVIDWVSATFPKNTVLFSLMGQFTPNGCRNYPELCRPITEEEYKKARDYMYLCGITNGYLQDLDSAKDGFIPAFDLSGV